MLDQRKRSTQPTCLVRQDTGRDADRVYGAARGEGDAQDGHRVRSLRDHGVASGFSVSFRRIRRIRSIRRH